MKRRKKGSKNKTINNENNEIVEQRETEGSSEDEIVREFLNCSRDCAVYFFSKLIPKFTIQFNLVNPFLMTVHSFSPC